MPRKHILGRQWWTADNVDNIDSVNDKHVSEPVYTIKTTSMNASNVNGNEISYNGHCIVNRVKTNNILRRNKSYALGPAVSSALCGKRPQRMTA